jgi:hypothetical protein
MKSSELKSRSKKSPLTGEELLSFRLWLQKQLTDRCQKNSKYSLRAFAKYLQINPASLSQILSGKRVLSKAMMLNICERLSVRSKELRNFGLIEMDTGDSQYLQLSYDTFSVISDWYHYAILELTYVPDFKEDPRWLSRKLGISVVEAKEGVQRLLRMGLLIKNGDVYSKAAKQTTNLSTVNTSLAHRQFQKSVLEKALEAIAQCPPEEKDITSITMAIDVNLLGQAKEKIKKFRRELCCFLEDGEQSRVYHLAIQLYPISKGSIEESGL